MLDKLFVNMKRKYNICTATRSSNRTNWTLRTACLLLRRQTTNMCRMQISCFDSFIKTFGNVGSHRKVFNPLSQIKYCGAVPGWARAGAVARKYDNTFYKSDLCREFSIILPPRLQPPTTSILICTLLKPFLLCQKNLQGKRKCIITTD